MHRLIIENLGPIKNCDIDINKMMILTGPQSNGKSTVAKAIFFFRTIKDDILTSLLKRADSQNVKYLARKNIERLLRGKFLQVFGTSWTMRDMKLKYFYTESCSIEISLCPGKDGAQNYIWVDLGYEIISYLAKFDDKNIGIDSDMKLTYKTELENLFNDKYETVFVPAGRSMITLLTSQLNYIFTMMDEDQKRLLDYCTQNYMERILKLKPLFSLGIDGMLDNKKYLTQKKFDANIVKKAIDLVNRILHGKYQYVGGEERLFIENEHYVKINFTSSGQQESVWILNLIFYYLLENKSVFFIFEEPESHLYPDAQKLIAELISLAISNENQGLITTHSPYVLGTINNLLYAEQLYEKHPVEVLKILKENHLIKRQLINFDDISANFVTGGYLRNCINNNVNLIQNEVIDGASEKINKFTEKLFDIE